MQKNKLYKGKSKRSEPSTFVTNNDEHDLAFFLHDRVALMREVFSLIKPKELKSIAPDCVRNVSNDDLEELCLEELLGISSKRLCAVLDGAPPPSDTESSSTDHSDDEVDVAEVISLDSRSSDGERRERNKKKKHKQKKSKAKKKEKKKRKSSSNVDTDSSTTPKNTTANKNSTHSVETTRVENEVVDISGSDKNVSKERKQSKAAQRAGLTVLELLELQARARAIRSQLQSQADKNRQEPQQEVEGPAEPESDDDVEIKEEAAEVVEILSSDEEAPVKVESKETEPQPSTSKTTVTSAVERDISKQYSMKSDKNKQQGQTIEKQTKDKTPTNEKPQITKDKRKIDKNSQKQNNYEIIDITNNPSTSKTTMMADVERDTTIQKEQNTEKQTKNKTLTNEKPHVTTNKTKKGKQKITFETNEYSQQPNNDDVIDITNNEDGAEEHEKDKTITKSEHDFTITIPQNKEKISRKIKLTKKNMLSISVPNVEKNCEKATEANTNISTERSISLITSPNKDTERTITIIKHVEPETKRIPSTVTKVIKAPKKYIKSVVGMKVVEKINEGEKRKKKKDVKKKVEKEKSPEQDHDEITLELSDSEKMDLLEGRNSFNKVSSSSSSSDSEPDSPDSTEKSENDNEDRENSNCMNVDASKKRDEERAKENDVDEKSKQSVKESNESQIEHNTNNGNSINSENLNDNDNSTSMVTKDNETAEPELPTNIQSMDIPTKVIEDSETRTSKIAVVKPFDEKLQGNIENTIEVSCVEDIRIVEDDKDIQINDNDTAPNSYNVAEEVTSEVCENTKSGKNEDTSSETIDTEEIATEQGSDDVTTTIKSTQSLDKLNEITDILNANATENSARNKSEGNDCIQNSTENADQITNEVSEKSMEEESKESEPCTKTNQAVSDGEVTDETSSEIEAHDVHPEVVCISDDDAQPASPKKKKSKKQKKEKKKKDKKKDFCENADHNFYRNISELDNVIEVDNVESDCKISNTVIDDKVTDSQNEVISSDVIIDDADVMIEDQSVVSAIKTDTEFVASPLNTDDDVYEILELSDDSSCYEVEGTVLSKEPTAEEIEALSAKIDEIKREDVVTNEEIIQHELYSKTTELENISWKDRYLESKKVKKVLTTANILNALRKKNKELKKKMQEVKSKEEEVVEEKIEELKEVSQVEEGSIEHYKTLQGSTKYVDPVKEPDESNINNDETESDINPENIDRTDTNEGITNPEPDKNKEENVTKEMKKDAKQLLKMYKRLLKYNDMTIVKDKKKNKKKKRNKNKSDEPKPTG